MELVIRRCPVEQFDRKFTRKWKDIVFDAPEGETFEEQIRNMPLPIDMERELSGDQVGYFFKRGKESIGLVAVEVYQRDGLILVSTLQNEHTGRLIDWIHKQWPEVGDASGNLADDEVDVNDKPAKERITKQLPGRRANQRYVDGFERIYLHKEKRKEVIDELVHEWEKEQIAKGWKPNAADLEAERKRILSGIDYQKRKFNRQ